jgi:hypothetical protein
MIEKPEKIWWMQTCPMFRKDDEAEAECVPLSPLESA